MGQLLCCLQVKQSTVAMKERFGRFNEVLEPGCHCVPWFCGSQIRGHLSLRVQKLEVQCESKSKRKQRMLFISLAIQGSKSKLMSLMAMSNYGFEIVQTLIIDVVPAETVKKAMNEINAAARTRVATQDKAEAEKILQIKQAEAEAEAKYLSGLGIARQRQAIVDGLRDSVLGFSVNVPETSAKDVMDMILVTQYFDTMKEIGASSVFIPHGPGAVRDVAGQIRDGLLQAGAH